MRKGFFINRDCVATKVTDHVGKFVPEQCLSLREMLMQYAYISGEKVEEIVNRGFVGDEDDDLLGVDVGALDFAEIHDRALYLHKSLADVPEPDDGTVEEPAEEPEQQPDADA